ncbi:MAG: pitrilysin family protein [Kiloniellales bacterium]|nr:pitrilysin family protein [Kiloniellales bacterium]
MRLIPTPTRLLGVILIGLLWAFPARAVDVQRVVSPGGIEAWLVEDHANPIISVEFSFEGGAALDPAGREGLANLASGLLDEGAGPLDSQAFQARLEDLAIRLSFSSGRDSFGGQLRTLSENRETAFDLLRLALTEPRFDPEPVERIRGQILAGLRRDLENPSAIAGRTLRKLLFPTHNYGRPSRGTPESVASITAEDLRAFAAQRLTRGGFKVAVVGDLTTAELATLLDKTFLGLPAETSGPGVADTGLENAGEVVVVQREIPQSVVTFAHGGLKRDDPDFYAAYVVNHILGGGSFSSRLYQEVREKRGLAYSVYSYLGPLDHAALIGGGVATQNARVGETLEVIRSEWGRMAEDGPTAEELEAAKTFLTGSYPLRQSSTGRIAGMLLAIQEESLGIDYINRRNDLIEAVTLEDVRRVAKRLYDAEELTVVVVGMPEGVSPTREAPAADGS